jgi:hypothetical protein
VSKLIEIQTIFGHNLLSFGSALFPGIFLLRCGSVQNENKPCRDTENVSIQIIFTKIYKYVRISIIVE